MPLHIEELLQRCRDHDASDLHCTVGAPPLMRKRGGLVPMGDEVLDPEMTEHLAMEILTQRQMDVLRERRSIDLATSIDGIGRFRINVYHQRGSISIAIRRLADEILDFHELGLPPIVSTFADLPNGLVLVTGVTGSGKSTTLATIIDRINRGRQHNIITIEDPIEYRHENRQSIVNQRELHTDVLSFADALREALRQDPDVIMVGEMRDLETTRTAIMAAETGHLVFSTLHSRDAVASVNRMVGQFSAAEQAQVRSQLAGALKAVVSQQLLPKANGLGRVPAVEVMTVTPGIGNLLRQGKEEQIYSAIETGTADGMQTMEQHLLRLATAGAIDPETAAERARNPRDFRERLAAQEASQATGNGDGNHGRSATQRFKRMMQRGRDAR
ncbi:MAG: type IV pilus twitching motility protein PilT [Planctomycetota bacterium]